MIGHYKCYDFIAMFLIIKKYTYSYIHVKI